MITFEEVKELFKESIDIKDNMNQALENLIQSIYLKGYNEALAQESRWISVSERLPKKAFGCLVTVEEDDIHGEPQRVIYPDFVGYDGEKWNDADGKVIPFDVIAWMPSPPPYKAESEEPI